MALILDTSAVISFAERRNPKAIDAVRQHGRSSIRSPFVLAEIEHGVGVHVGSKKQQSDRRKTLDAYIKLTELPTAWDPWRIQKRFVDVTVAAAHNNFAARLAASQHDRWIIAEAIHHGAKLLTCDQAQAETARLWSEATAENEHLDVLFVEP